MSSSSGKSTRSKSSKTRSSKSSNPLITCLVVVAILAAGGIYLITGEDILGLFTAQETPVAQVTQEEVVPEEATTEPDGIPTEAASTQSVAAGGEDWWQVYFADPATHNDETQLGGSIPEKLIGFINEAQTSIHIAAFEFNLTPVAEALIAAKKRGVDVKWITDDEHGLEADSEEGHGQFALLQKAKIPLKDDQRSGLMHNKFWIFDSEIVWTGSTNITVNDNFRNNNNVIVLFSPEVAAIYEEQFADMWAGQFSPKSPSDIEAQKLNIEGTDLQILFSPEDDAISHILPLVEQAQKSIYFMAFSFTQDDLTQAMLARAKKKVVVQGIFETRASETQFSALPPMFCAKLPVRQDGNPGTFHHKVIIIDERIVITGSLNFSDNANNQNSENTLILDNPQLAALYLQEFQRRWAEATPPKAEDMKCK